MTKEYLETILTEYGVAFTDSLADRLLKEFEPCEDEYIKVPKKALKYRTVGMVAYNVEWLKNHFDIERAVICGEQQPCNDAISRETVKIEYKRRFESSLKDESRGLDLTHLADCTRFNEFIDSIPTVKPQYTEDEIQKMQDLEQAEIEKAYELGKVEKQECEDTISRQAVNTLIDELARAISDERCCISRGRSTATIMRDILHLPPFIPQPKVGRWIYGEDNSGTGRDGWYCNQCGHFEFWDYSSDMKSAELNLPNLCPNCKAKMQEVKDDKRRN